MINLFLLCGTLRVRGTEALLGGASANGGMTTPRSAAGSDAKAPAAQQAVEDDDEDDDDDEGNGMAVLNMEDWFSYRCPPELAVQIQVWAA